jgi:hypothetical protein
MPSRSSSVNESTASPRPDWRPCNPRRTRRSQECGRSAAHRRALASAPADDRGGNFRPPVGGPMVRCTRHDRHGGHAQIPPRCAAVLLTRVKAGDYIRGSRCAVRLGVLARLRSSSLNASFHTRTRHPISVGSKGLRRLSGLRRAGPSVPGCLTGESEERETWTAESLRAVSFCRGATRGRRRRPDETSAVHVSGQHYCRASGRREREQSRARLSARTRVGPRQNVTSREKFSSNLRV